MQYIYIFALIIIFVVVLDRSQLHPVHLPIVDDNVYPMEYDNTYTDTLDLSQIAPYTKPFEKTMLDIHDGTYGVGW